VQVLRELKLNSAGRWRFDLVSLNSSEHADIVAALQEGWVALGDRSRLRAWVDSEGHGAQTRSPDDIFQRRLQNTRGLPVEAPDVRHFPRNETLNRSRAALIHVSQLADTLSAVYSPPKIFYCVFSTKMVY
jgi:hypothetical protein